MKKFISIILMLTLLMALSPTNFALEQTAGEQLRSMGFLSGDQTGNLGEDQYLTRTEMMVILSRMLGEYEEAFKWSRTSTFSDRNQHWGERYVSYAQYKGWTAGIGNNSFGYNLRHTVQETSVFMLKALGYSAPNDFTWTTAYSKAKEIGLFENLYLSETSDILRGDLFKIMLKTLNTRIKGKNYSLLDKLEGFTASGTTSGDINILWVNGFMNEITIVFSDEMDISALSASNYRIDGRPLTLGTALYFTDSNKDEVVITLPSNSITKSNDVLLTISDNVISAENEKLGKEDLNQIIDGLIDNVKPELLIAEKTESTALTLTFSEDLDVFNEFDFIVKVNQVELEIFGHDFIEDNVIKIFVSTYNTVQEVTVETIEDPDGSTDVAGNYLVGEIKVTAIAAN